MKHIFFIDPVEKLVPKKDSTFLMALTAKKKGIEAYFLFEKDFFIGTDKGLAFDVYEFDGQIEENFYISNFKLGEKRSVNLDQNVVLHMRIDPPYDSRYQRYLWMLDFLMGKGVDVRNNPLGIMKNNEKITAYKRKGTLSTFVGASMSRALEYLERLKEKGITEYIFKPVDLYQGIGVKKVTSDDNLEKEIESSLKEFQGPIVIQPFVQEVQDGEIRTIFYKAKEIGTILKVPPKGNFLANIAQGATYDTHPLPKKVEAECIDICKELLEDGIDLVAFDILGNIVSEVNVTCPGLMVEVSAAKGVNLTQVMFE